MWIDAAAAVLPPARDRECTLLVADALDAVAPTGSNSSAGHSDEEVAGLAETLERLGEAGAGGLAAYLGLRPRRTTSRELRLLCEGIAVFLRACGAGGTTEDDAAAQRRVHTFVQQHEQDAPAIAHCVATYASDPVRKVRAWPALLADLVELLWPNDPILHM